MKHVFNFSPKNLLIAAAALTLNVSPAFADNTPQERTTIKVNLVEMKFEIEGAAAGTPLKFKALKPYKLVFENKGTMRHEILFGRNLIVPTDPAGELDYKEKLFGTNMEMLITGSWLINNVKKIFYAKSFGLEEIELDDSIRMAVLFTFPKSKIGKWEMACFMPGHYQMGMKLPVYVE